MCAEEWTFVRAVAKGRAKVTMLSAQQAAAYYDPEKSRDAYPTRDAYLADIVDISRREVQGRAAGLHIHPEIDGPQYGALLDSKMREGTGSAAATRGADRPLHRMDNASSTAIRASLQPPHLPRHSQSKFYAEATTSPSPASSEDPFDRFLLEYDDARSGGF
jgi:5-methyltetrahydropteroyltriglutamate--homocysteine methyltransferase